MNKNNNTQDFNRNDKQRFFNCIKGNITEFIQDGNFCGLILTIGHGNPREAHLVMKKEVFEERIDGKFSVGQKVSCKFFISSKNKNGRWYTSANFLDIELDNEV